MTINAEQSEGTVAESAAEVPADCKIAAAVVNPVDGKDATYFMFDVEELTAEGVFLVGQLFFEVDEEFSLQLSGSGEQILVRARVVSLERGETAGMTVAFEGLDTSDRQRLEELAKRVAAG